MLAVFFTVRLSLFIHLIHILARLALWSTVLIKKSLYIHRNKDVYIFVYNTHIQILPQFYLYIFSLIVFEIKDIFCNPC